MDEPMTSSTASAPALAEIDLVRRQRSLWGDAWRRLIGSSNGRLGLAICLFLIVIAVIIPLAQPYDPRSDRNLRARLLPPSWLMSPEDRDTKKLTSWSYPFGT